MSIRLITYEHVLSPRRDVEDVPWGNPYASFVGAENAIIWCDDVQVPRSKWNDVPPDGSVVMVRKIPGDPGSALIATGVVALISFIGTLAVVGTQALNRAIGADYPIFADLAGNLSPAARKELSPSIRGAGNSENPWGPVPVVLGKHYLAPPYMGKPYTEISGTDQYIHLSFLMGHAPMKVRNIRIGENLLWANAAGSMATYTIGSGYFEGIELELTDGTAPCIYYPARKNEDQFSIESKCLTAPNAVKLLRNTPPGTTKIETDIEFPNGLVDGTAGSASVGLSVRYWDAFTGSTGTGTTLFVDTVTTAVASIYRLSKASGTVPASTYTVEFFKTTKDAEFNDNNTVKDKVVWTSIRSTLSPTEVIRASIADSTVRLSMKVKASDVVNGTIGQINAECSSVVPIFTPGTSGVTAWTVEAESANPAALALYLLRTINPQPPADANIDWSSFETLYTWCAGHDSLGSTGSFVNTCNAVLDAQMPLREALARVLSTARAQLKMDGSIYSVVHDDYKTTPYALITPRNSWDFTGSKAFNDEVHAYRVKFINEDAGWQEDERLVLDDGYYYTYSINGVTGAYDWEGGSVLTGLTVATKIETIDKWGITDPDLAFREGRYLIASRRLRPEIFSVKQDFESIGYQRGDLVRLGHDVPLLGVTGGRVVSYASGVLTMDEPVTIENAKTYGVRYQNGTAGTIVFGSVATTTVGSYYDIAVENFTPVSSPDPAAGDLFWFGELATNETHEAVVVGIEPNDDLTATVYLQDYNEGIYSADIGSIPTYTSNVTVPSEKVFPVAWGQKATKNIASQETNLNTQITKNLAVEEAGAATPALVVTYTPHYLGKYFNTDPGAGDAHPDNWYLRYSATSGSAYRGIFVCAAEGAWPAAADDSPTTAQIAAAWPDITTVVNLGSCGTVVDYVGSLGVNYIEVLGANLAFINSLFANTITVTGEIKSDNYVAGTSGFRLVGTSGTVYAVDADISGTLRVGSGGSFYNGDGHIKITEDASLASSDGLIISNFDQETDPVNKDIKMIYGFKVDNKISVDGYGYVGTVPSGTWVQSFADEARFLSGGSSRYKWTRSVNATGSYISGIYTYDYADDPALNSGEAYTETTLQHAGTSGTYVLGGVRTKVAVGENYHGPVYDNVTDLGRSSYKWKDGYFSGSIATGTLGATGTVAAAVLSSTGGVSGTVLTSTNYIDCYKVEDDSNGIVQKSTTTNTTFTVKKPITCVLTTSGDDTRYASIQIEYNSGYLAFASVTGPTSGIVVTLAPGDYKLLSNNADATATLTCIGVFGAASTSDIWT